MSPVSDPRVQSALAALPDGTDAASLRDGPSFEALDTEMRKLERDGPLAVHWPDVVRQAQHLLAAEGKDLGVAAWLAVALGTTEGLAGLATGLEIFQGLVAQYWSMATPTRPRARVGIFDWLVSRAARLVPDDPPATDLDQAVRAEAALSRVDGLLVEKLPGTEFTLGELLRPLRALSQRRTRELDAERAEAAAAAVSVTPASPPVAAPSTPAAPVAVSATAIDIVVVPGNADRTISAMRDAVRTTALALIAADLAEWRGFRLLRAITWLSVTEPPPAAGPDGRTALMPPPATRMAEFDAAVSHPADLIPALETFCSGSGLFWLDGQRRSATALAALGPNYAECAREIAAGILGLLNRLPSLATLRFADGTPFADGATQAWLASIQPAAPVSAEPSEAAPWIAAFADARRTALAGDAEAALERLVAGTAAAPDRRQWAFWRLATARLCLETDNAAIAYSIARHLGDEIERSDLAAWEPGLAADAAGLLYRCLSLPTVASRFVDAPAQADAAFAKLARLDPVAASRLTRSGPP